MRRLLSSVLCSHRDITTDRRGTRCRRCGQRVWADPPESGRPVRLADTGRV